MKIWNTIKFWFNAARCFAVGQSLFAALLAIFIASTYKSFNILYGLFALVGVVFAHLTTNLLDDYFDFKLGSVEKRNALKSSGRTDKCSYLTNNEATPRQLFIASCVFGLIALAFGLIIFLHRGLPILFLTLAAVFLGLFYSAPPLKLSYHGLGELIVGLMFGPMLMNGVFYAATGTISLQLLLISCAIGSLVVNILYVHSIMDEKTDAAYGKKTLSTLLKYKYLKLVAVVFFAIYPYWVVFTGVLRYGMPMLALSVFVTLPHSALLIKLMIEYLNGQKTKYNRSIWHGPMENWKKIDSEGMGWFVARWYLARNITVFFCACLCIAYLIRALKG